MPNEQHPLKVFLCYAPGDRDAVNDLYQRLVKDGIDAWLDEEKLLPSQDRDLEIRKAVREADIVVICLSKQFNQAGFQQKEVRIALNEAELKPEGEIFIIPVRLDECDTLESLRKWHWVDLFEGDGYKRLLRSLQTRAKNIGLDLELSEVEGKVLKILVTGGRETSQTIKDVAFQIGYQVIVRGHILLNHGTRGVDEAAAEGARKACSENNYSPDKYIYVYRPKQGEIPEVAFGDRQTKGQTFQERRAYAIDQSNAVIILGGGHGTRDVAKQVRIAEKPLIPIGVGNPREAAVEIWRKMLNREYADTLISRHDLKKIGDPVDHNKISVYAVVLVEILSQK